MSFSDNLGQFFSGSIVQQVLIGFGSTFFGVLLAFLLTLRYDRGKKHQEEKEEKIRVLTATKEELQYNLESLTKLPTEHIMLTFANYCVTSAVYSGKFILLDPETQNLLDNLYEQFRLVEIIGERILSMVAISNTLVDIMKKMQSDKIAELKTHIPKVISLVQENLNSLDA